MKYPLRADARICGKIHRNRPARYVEMEVHLSSGPQHYRGVEIDAEGRLYNFTDGQNGGFLCSLLGNAGGPFEIVDMLWRHSRLGKVMERETKESKISLKVF